MVRSWSYSFVNEGVGEYQLGLYETEAGPLYVNAGIGYFYANVRFFCRPEITVFEI
jgi:predicted MPP superfamily phosphohydrolase